MAPKTIRLVSAPELEVMWQDNLHSRHMTLPYTNSGWPSNDALCAILNGYRRGRLQNQDQTEPRALPNSKLPFGNFLLNYLNL